MSRLLCLLLAIALTGCNRPAPSSPVSPDEEQDMYEQLLLAKWEQESHDKDAKSQAEYQLLPKADREEIDSLRAAIRKRPPVELTDAQWLALIAWSNYLPATEHYAYLVALANEHEGRELVRLLGLRDQRGFSFKEDYAKEPLARRAVVRKAVTTVVTKGYGPLTEEERAALRPNSRYLPAAPD